jgi:hypothetical protein
VVGAALYRIDPSVHVAVQWFPVELGGLDAAKRMAEAEFAQVTGRVPLEEEWTTSTQDVAGNASLRWSLEYQGYEWSIEGHEFPS